jgi:hypothetical protein
LIAVPFVAEDLQDEAGNAEHAHEAARLEPEAKKPLDAETLHPVRCSRQCLRNNVETAPHADRDTPFETIPQAGDKKLLAGHAKRYKYYIWVSVGDFFENGFFFG